MYQLHIIRCGTIICLCTIKVNGHIRAYSEQDRFNWQNTFGVCAFINARIKRNILVFDRLKSTELVTRVTPGKGKGKGKCIYIALIFVVHAQAWITQCHLQYTNACLCKCCATRNYRTQSALRQCRRDLRTLVYLLTEHNILNRHLTVMRRVNDPLCTLCKEEEETSCSTFSW